MKGIEKASSYGRLSVRVGGPRSAAGSGHDAALADQTVPQGHGRDAQVPGDGCEAFAVQVPPGRIIDVEAGLRACCWREGNVRGDEPVPSGGVGDIELLSDGADGGQALVVLGELS